MITNIHEMFYMAEKATKDVGHLTLLIESSTRVFCKDKYTDIRDQTYWLVADLEIYLTRLVEDEIRELERVS